jgi:hypothetical protein
MYIYVYLRSSRANCIHLSFPATWMHTYISHLVCFNRPQELDSVMQQVFLAHLFQVYSLWPIASDDKPNFGMFSAYPWHHCNQQIHALAVCLPRDNYDSGYENTRKFGRVNFPLPSNSIHSIIPSSTCWITYWRSDPAWLDLVRILMQSQHSGSRRHFEVWGLPWALYSLYCEWLGQVLVVRWNISSRTEYDRDLLSWMSSTLYVTRKQRGQCLTAWTWGTCS